MRNRIVVALLVVASSACMKSFERYHSKEVEIEAKVVMQSIKTALITGYIDRQKMCPPSTPVPADVDVLKAGPYQSQPADWDETWKCVFDTEHVAENPIGTPRQHFQYSVAPSADGTAQVVTAKGYPGGAADGIHTITMTCTVADQVLKCGDIEGLSK